MDTIMPVLAIIIICGIYLLPSMFSNDVKLSGYGIQDDDKPLRRDAKIVDVKYEKVGSRNNRKFRTTVYFSDGFRFVSTKTKVEGGFGTYTISVPKEILQEILEAAVEEHSKRLG